jgi:phosphatidylserine synthase
MNDLMRDAAWVLTATFTLSFLYETYRVTFRREVSTHDSPKAYGQLLPLYVAAAAVIALLFAGHDWAAWIGLTFSVATILVSIFYYNPQVMFDRRPALVDWFEDLVFTGLLFVAAALLIYEVLG